MKEWLGDRPIFFFRSLPPLLSIFFLSLSLPLSLLKRLSHWFAFCCVESGEVAQCVLVKAVPHLPGIIRQLCWKDPSLIPLWWPISHHKGVSGLFLFFSPPCRSLFVYPRPCCHRVLILWQLGTRENIRLPILTGLSHCGEEAKGNMSCYCMLGKKQGNNTGRQHNTHANMANESGARYAAETRTDSRNLSSFFWPSYSNND